MSSRGRGRLASALGTNGKSNHELFFKENSPSPSHWHADIASAGKWRKMGYVPWLSSEIEEARNLLTEIVLSGYKK